MATIKGVISYIASGYQGTPKSHDLYNTDSINLPYPRTKQTSFKNRVVRVLRVTSALVAVAIMLPFVIIHKPISLMLNENHYFLTKEINKHNNKVVAEKNDDNKNYTTLLANIIKVIFIQLLLAPAYIIYGMLFAGFDFTNYVLNYITKEKNQLILESFRPIERKFPINHV